jgi:hypothetical protein
MEPLPASTSRIGARLALLGIVLQIVSVLGVMIASGLEIDAMSILNAHGPTTLNALGVVLGRSLFILTFCTVSFFASLALLCLALAVYRCRTPWFFWFLAIYSWPLLLIVPFGTAAALFFLIYTLSRRDEFIPTVPVALA